MLTPEDLADLVDVLRGSGFKPSPQQAFGAQQLVLQLAAAGALPASAQGLAGYLAPIFCTSAAEQDQFGAVYAAWLARRFESVPPTPAPRPRVRERVVQHLSPGRVAAYAAALLLLVAGAWWMARPDWSPWPDGAVAPPDPVASEPGRQPAEPSKPEPVPAGVPVKIASFELAPLLPAPTLAERISWPGVGLSALPLLLFGAWQLMRRRRRPVLQRTASRTPARLREVHLPGGVRLLLPRLPMRRLAQEMRRRRDVPSEELQVEPTIVATLRAGGLFTPVRGSRVEPEYLALVDRAALADHQALLGAELIAELARADVLVERFDFDHDATVCRPRDAMRGAGLHAGHAAQAGSGTGRAAAARTAWKARELHSVDLADLHERHPDHRMLVFGDGAGCFDAFTGAPAPWLLTLLQWPLPVLLTPRPIERWSRREWALQRLGVQVLPLTRAGLLALGALYAAGRGEATGVAAPGRPDLPMHERTPRRWLERDPPPADTIERLCTDLRLDLGPRGFAWLAACAAYPEVHWGITLRLGPALVHDGAELERLLPRLARLVWLRDAFMPDWLREALIERLDDADEALARHALRTMLEALAERREGDIPLRIALGEPRTEWPWWRRLWAVLRERGLRARTADLLRTAPPDSPLRDHVFLRFLSGQQTRRIDLAAPGALLRLLRATPRAVPAMVGALSLALSGWLAAQLQVVSLDEGHVGVRAIGFEDDGRSVGVMLARDFTASPTPLRKELAGAPDGWFPGPARTSAEQAMVRWRLGAAAAEPVPPQVARFESRRVEAVHPGSGQVILDDDGTLRALALDADGVPTRPGRALSPGGDQAEQVRFSADGRRVAVVGRKDWRVWDVSEPVPKLLLQRRGVEALPPEQWDFGARGNWLALRTPDDKATLFRVGDPERDFSVPVADWARHGQLRLASDERSLVLFESKATFFVRVNLETRRVDEERQLNDAKGDRVVALSPDLSHGVGVQREGVILGGDRVSGFLGLRTLDIDRNASFTAAFSPDNRLFVTLGDDGLAQAWDTRTGTRLGEPLRPAGPKPVDGAAAPLLKFSEDGRLLAIVVGDELEVWSVPGAAAPELPQSIEPTVEVLPDVAQKPPEGGGKAEPTSPTDVVSARAQLLAKYPALREKTLALVGLRVRHGWIVDAVTPVFAEVLADGSLGKETWEGARVGGGGGGETLVQRPGQVISELVVQRGRYESAQLVASIDVRFRPQGPSTSAGLGYSGNAVRPPLPNVGANAIQDAVNRAAQDAAADAARRPGGLPQSGTSANRLAPALSQNAAQAYASTAPQRVGLAKGALINEAPQRYAIGAGEVFSDLRLAAALNNNRTPYLGVLEALATKLPLPEGLNRAAPEPAASAAAALRDALAQRTVGELLERMNDADEAVRRSATATLIDEHRGNALAVDMAIAQLAPERFEALRPEARVNVLTFLSRANPAAWSSQQRSLARQSIETLWRTDGDRIARNVTGAPSTLGPEAAKLSAALIAELIVTSTPAANAPAAAK